MKPSDTEKPWFRKLHWQIVIAMILGVLIGGAARNFYQHEERLDALEEVVRLTRAGETEAVREALTTLTAEDGLFAEHEELLEALGQLQVDGVASIESLVEGALLAQAESKTVFYYPGELFLRLLKMIVLPLIIASVIVGVSSLDPKHMGRIGVRTLIFYLSTTTIAVLLGMLVVNVLQPGVGAELNHCVATVGCGDGQTCVEGLCVTNTTLRPDPIGKILLDIVPKNVFESLGSSDILSIIFFSILFGLALTYIGREGRVIRAFFGGLNDAVMRMTMWIMALAPIGVFGLLADVIVTTGFGAFDELLMYMLAVLIGLGVHALVVLPLILKFVGKRSPAQYAKQMSPALLTAFSTSSSAATLPVTIRSIEKRAGVRRTIAEFVLPLGATVNMDGTALYEAVAVMFIAQAYGIDMSFSAQLVVVLTATLAAIGAAGVPRAGLVTMVLVLEAVHLPTAAIGLILAVDAILDMCRTTVNVWGDSVGAAVIDALEAKDSGDEPIGEADPGEGTSPQPQTNSEL